jgi:hypothetical protein
MVLNPWSDRVPQVRHQTFCQAQAEAIRIAGKEGRKVHVLRVVGTAHPPAMPQVTWEDRPE